MSERAKLAASSAAWVAAERLSEFLVALEEMEHPLTQVQRAEITHIALRSFDGTMQAIEQSLSMEEILQSMAKPKDAAA